MSGKIQPRGCRTRILLRILRYSYLALLLVLPGLASTTVSAGSDTASPAATLASLSQRFDRLAPQTIHPATQQIQRPYLIPAGYYQQMWDWDSFFIGIHWADRNPAGAKYLKWWVQNFADFIKPSGYVAGCITPRGPLPEVEPLVGGFAIKPFLAQGAYIAAERLHDYAWLAPLWPKLQSVAAYRDREQFDAKWGLYYWENAMQSGADNNAALTNDPHDKNAILAVDASVYALREDLAMAAIAGHLGKKQEAARYRTRAAALRRAILRNLYSPKDAIFWNRRRDSGAFVRTMAFTNFLPLTEGLLPPARGRAMIRRHLLNTAEMRSPYGFRSLSKSDPAFNNQAIITPYSNWRGPIWINAAYMHWLALRRYGFHREAADLATSLAHILARDIDRWRSMHEDYNSETGDGLAPTPAQSPGGRFAGFVGWNLLAQDMLECESSHRNCDTFSIPSP